MNESFKFDEPLKTKSGKSVVTIWNELKECWAIYKTARINQDMKKMTEYENKIRELQADLSIKQTEFPM